MTGVDWEAGIKLATAFFEVASKVAELILRTRGSGPSKERDALDLTLTEWEGEAYREALRCQADLPARELSSPEAHAESLLATSRAFRLQFRISDSQSALRSHARPIYLNHSALEVADPNNLLLQLGTSDATRILRGQTAMIPLNTSRPPASQRRLPVFRVTMLGASGVGKTVFMSSMYAILRLGVEQLSIKATDGDVDLELDVNMKNIYANHKFPEGNEAKQKQYKFELRNGDNPVAGIDWVDYRGGDLRAGPNTPEGQAIVERLKSSHAVLWMVDLSSVEGQKMDSFAARLKTEIGRMATLSREAAVSNEPRAWIFVRTKSDRVKNKNSEKDWRRAADELRIHLGDTIKTIIQNPLSRAALVPISSVGTVDEVGDRKVVAGEDPSFVQWPLMLALAFLLDAEAQKLALRHNKLVNDIRSSQSDGGFLPILRRFLDLGPSDEQRAMIHELSAIGQAFVGISENVQALMRTVPPEVVVLQSPNDTHS